MINKNMKTAIIFISTGKKSYYKKFIRSMEILGFKVHYINLEWKHKTLSDWINQARIQIKRVKQPFHLVGFSVGAMVALILAKESHPRSLIICSLSPFFNDIKYKIPSHIKNTAGKKRLNDFKKYNLKEITKNIKNNKIPTSIFVGSKEIPIMIKTAKYLNRFITNSSFHMEKACKHDINCFDIKAGLPKEACSN